MSLDQVAATLWRRRWVFAITFALCLGAVILVTFLLKPTYTSTATLFVGGQPKEDAFVDTRLLEQHTRTYATLAGNPNTASLVTRRYELGLSRSALLEHMSFSPVERTQLLLFSAKAASPERARFLANSYAQAFTERMMALFRSGRAPARIAITEPAALPSAPSSPNRPLYLGLGGLLALMLALGVALLRERLDWSIRVSRTDNTVLDEPIMARIPRIDKRKKIRPREVTDRFALLKTNLDLFDEEPARVVLVTSAVASEGKSTVAANLAAAAAQDGEKIALVEADLRRPGLDPTRTNGRHRTPRPGLSSYLAGAARLEEVLRPHPDYPGVSVVWAGPTPPNPATLLGSSRLDTLIDTLRARFDRVIIDTCPISVGADASVIASHVDGVLFVIDERKTRRGDALAGINQLRGVRARLLGIALNRSRSATGDGYYYGGEERSDVLTKTPKREGAGSA